MNSETTFILSGLSRVLNSAKVQTTAGSLVAAWFAIHYAAADLPPNQRTALWVAFIVALLALVRECLAGWTAEDVAAKSAPAAPAVQVNAPDTQTINTPAQAQQAINLSDRPIPISK